MRLGARRPTEPLRPAMAAARRRGEPRLDLRHRLVRRALAGERRNQRRALNLAEITQLLDKCLEILRLHARHVPAANHEPSVDLHGVGTEPDQCDHRHRPVLR